MSEPKNELAEIHTAYKYAAKKYRRKRYSIRRRFKATYLILFAFAIQELFFLVYAISGKKHYSGLRTLSIFAWLVFGTLLLRIL